MPQPLSPFVARHIGPRPADIEQMLQELGYRSLDELTRAVVPSSILDLTDIPIASGVSEEEAMHELRQLASRNRVMRSLIGQGYYGTFTPRVILRNVLENPAWYTAYTPYQPEISQGRLELLFYFQTMVAELTGLPVANASLLDEATAAAEAMALCHRATRGTGHRFFVSKLCHPQTIEVVQTRALPLGIEVVLFDEEMPPSTWEGMFGVLVQYPATDGTIRAYDDLIAEVHQQGGLVVMATDLLALTMLRSPGQLGADIAIGNAQRFGVPLGFGGPHAAFMATTDEHKRMLPGRLVGQSIDRHGKPAYRLSLQTREQHIRREKATSNICTAQALLAMMSTLYACYHGPEGLKAIASRVHGLATRLYAALKDLGLDCRSDQFFDTVTVAVGRRRQALLDEAVKRGFNLRSVNEQEIGIALDETVTEAELKELVAIFGGKVLVEADDRLLAQHHRRSDPILSQRVFHRYRSETEMMRYLRKLSEMDIALDRAMIPLGSCTMKLNAASELTPITWPEWNGIHPFAPVDQTRGYQAMIEQLESMLCAITGYAAVSLQPNAGSQGEYAGLLAIMRYHASRGDNLRNVCLIPSSAHGTNPASAQMANMQVVVVKCDAAGNIDLIDLEKQIAAYPARIAAIMVTYPSTHGVFEDKITQVCDMVHAAGGQVYIDGANLNALVGVSRPGRFGGDVSHLNLHKTFCIPHGGGGPGVGPVAVARHLAPFLPRDGVHPDRQGALVSAAPFGSASILPISWMYIRMMGPNGLRLATQVAILNANYVAHRLKDHYPILYTGQGGLVAHECIVDTRPMDKDGHVTVEDIAKRLIDFGFHSPTMSFPVPGTLMVEPTESESKEELDRFCRAMTIIYREYEKVRDGVWPADNNPLVNAPHTLQSLLDDAASRTYGRREAVSPDPEADDSVKYWPPVGRVDNVYGDRNLVCACPPLESYQDIPAESLP